MIFLALTRSGFADVARDALRDRPTIWVNADVASATELEALRAQGIGITAFTRAVDPADEAAIQQALDTIEQHHAGQIIWIERGAVA